MQSDNSVRIDKWLWASRFFKTRSMAAKAVNGGKVSLNDSRIKASRSVKPGDILHIVKGQLEFTIEVLKVSKYRRPASEASELYCESDESLEARRNKMEMIKFAKAGEKKPPGKPGKRDRRKIREFTRKD